MRRLILLVALTALAASPPPETKVPLPAGTVIAVVDSVAEALKLMPSAVVLSPEKYQSLLDEIARLKKLSDKPRVRLPSKCAIKGKVEGGLALLQATFEFDTDQPNTLIRLGCSQGSATGISLDGKTPALVGDTSKSGGFAVEVDKPGDHILTLDLVVPLNLRPGGQGLTLDLPRAAITSLDLTLPPASRDVRLAGKTPAEARVTFKDARLESDSLGPTEKLDIAWRTPSATTTGSILAADGVIAVRIDPRDTITEARLSLRVLGGQTRAWPLLVPAGAEVTVDAAHVARVENIDKADQKGLQLRTIRLKADSTDPLNVVVRTTMRTPRPGSGKPMTVGPFTVVGVAGQSGTIHVTNTAPDLHLKFGPPGDLRRLPLSDDETRKDPSLVASFAYGPSASPGPGWLDIDTEVARGQIKVKLTHTLRLAEEVSSWFVESELTVTPRWADVDRLVVNLPPGLDFVSDGSYPLDERLRSVHYESATRQVEFRLSRATEATTPFKAKLVCRVAADVDLAQAGQIVLPLPRPGGIVEPDSVLRVVAPERVRLVPNGSPSGLDLMRQSTHELIYRCPRRLPESLAFGWEPYRSLAEVLATVDVTLGATARVRHELNFTFPDGARPVQKLDVPAAVLGSLVVRQGEARMNGQSLTFIPPGKLVLEYEVRPTSTSLLVPLITPEQVTRLETKVRIWSDGGRLPTRPPSGWSESNIEDVPGRTRLPVMVLRSTRIDRTLKFDLGEDLASRVLIERALARVEIASNGTQDYRVGFRVARLAGSWLDLELPAPIASLGLTATLDGKVIDPVPLLADRPELKGKLVRLKLSPDLVRGPSVLELAYQLSADRQTATPVTTTLLVPRLRDEGAEFPLRWQIHTPGHWVLLGPEPAVGLPRVWGRSGWLLASRMGTTGADLDRWLIDGPAAEAAETLVPSTIVARETDDPVTLLHVPRQAWLVGCSAMLVLLGLMGVRLVWGGPNGEGSAWAWPVAIFVGVVALFVALLMPGLATAIAFGIQPGLLVLLLLVPLDWLLTQRRRRQVIFLANFTRAKPGSSHARIEDAPGSTVDVPRSIGSSLERQGSGS